MVEHPGRIAEVVLEVTAQPVIIGQVGELHPGYLAQYEIRADRICFATLNVALMTAAWRQAPEVREIDRLPAAERDIAVIVARDLAAADVAAVIRATAGRHLARLDLFDRYQGPPLAENEVSLAYRLRFQPRDRPISETEIEQAIESVARALEREVGGRIRSGS